MTLSDLKVGQVYRYKTGNGELEMVITGIKMSGFLYRLSPGKYERFLESYWVEACMRLQGDNRERWVLVEEEEIL